MTAPPVKPLPNQNLLREILNYDPATGRLTRKATGLEAFTYSDAKGYRHGKIQGKLYQAHRIIWKLVYGNDPETIDHRNGIQGDNRLANLREASMAENSRNYRKANPGTSKYRGVYWVGRDQKWAARISCGKSGKRSLGNYSDEVKAALAYDAAAREFHGEFAVLNFPGDSE